MLRKESSSTPANPYLALEHDLEIIPIINKIDLPAADPERVKRELEDNIGLDASEAILASAKTGEGIDEILEAIVHRIPAPKGDAALPLRALIFDSHYDPYRGVVAYVRVVEGNLTVGDNILTMSTGRAFEVDSLGVFKPQMVPVDLLSAGDVGCVIAGMKDVKDAPVGDTITLEARPATTPLPGYRPVTPMVYCGLYPVDNEDHPNLRDALERLKLNDAALVFEPETSVALGFGFRCGFLGLLHMEIIQERLEREFELNLITTAPSVVYHVFKVDGSDLKVDNPALLPPAGEFDRIEEPFVRAGIMTPEDFIGPVMETCQERRGTFVNMEYVATDRVQLTYDLPLSEIITDFFDRLKSRTKGFALDYEPIGYQDATSKAGYSAQRQPVDALSTIVHGIRQPIADDS